MIVRRHHFKFANGDPGIVFELENNECACPVCGAPIDGPYVNILGLSGGPYFGDVCECCNTEFGVDEGGVPDYAPAGTNAKVYARLRNKWLTDRAGWSTEGLTQLKNNLEMSEDQVRREAEEIQRERQNG
jgi:hypothetical protein